MKLFPMSTFAAIALLASGLIQPAQADVTYPTERAYFPVCATEGEVNCYSNPQIKLPNASTWTTPSSDVYFGVNAFDIASGPSLVVDMRLGGNQGEQDLSSVLPVGTEITLDIRTGNWQPNPQAHGVAKINGFSQNQNVNGNWTTSVDFTTTNWSPASNCSVDDGCENPGTANGNDPNANGYQGPFWHDYASFAQVVFWGVSLTATADDVSWWHKWDGMYTSSNASSGYGPWYDTDNSAWVIQKAAPARTQNGLQTNWLMFNAFIPDHSILEVYGINGADAAPNFKVTRQNDGTTTQVPLTASIQHISEPNPGVLISIPRYSFDLNPTALDIRGIRSINSPAASGTLRVKYVRPAPGKTRVTSKSSVDGTATFRAQAMTGATSYEASCTKGSTTKTGTANFPTVNVRNLTEGTWSCKVRAKNATSGAWSTAVSVSISFNPEASTITDIQVVGNFARIFFDIGERATDVNVKCVKGGTTKTGTAMLAFGTAPVKITKGTWKCSIQSVRKYGGKNYFSAWSPAETVKK